MLAVKRQPKRWDFLTLLCDPWCVQASSEANVAVSTRLETVMLGVSVTDGKKRQWQAVCMCVCVGGGVVSGPLDRLLKKI